MQIDNGIHGSKGSGLGELSLLPSRLLYREPCSAETDVQYTFSFSGELKYKGSRRIRTVNSWVNLDVYIFISSSSTYFYGL